jgi:ABC-type polysaccharide/polyol phosphate export permease
MMMYVVVFQFIFRQSAPDGSPYVVWFLPGMAMWMCINDGIIGASGSIRNYSYLVKKVVFPVDVIPLISLFANSFVAVFLFLVATSVCLIVGFSCNVLMLLYSIFAAYCFLVAFTRFTSAVCTVVPDFSNLLTIMMQLFFWATPIVWDITLLANHATISTVIKCMPFTYLVTSFRNSFMNGNIVTENNGLFTIIFWVVTILIFIWGNYIFKKSKKDFADVL